MTENDSTIIHIDDLAYGGDGVGRHKGKVVFIPGALPGENVKVRIDSDRKRFARGSCLSIEGRSAARCDADCPLADSCVGCAYQTLQYDEEVTWKRKQLIDLLTRVGKISSLPEISAIDSPSSLGYRNKIVLHADAEGRLGYKGRDNRTVLDIPDCPLAVAPIREEIATFRQKHIGSLQAGDRVTFRWTATDGVTSWINNHAPKKDLTEIVDGSHWRVSSDGFWQINHTATPLLLRTVQDMLQVAEVPYLLDLYCGAGFFALACAGRFENVLGIERDQGSVRAAKANALQKDIDAVTFIEGDAADMYAAAQDCVSPDETVVLVDPPRKGLDPLLMNQLLDYAPKYFLYVSCAADTLARDCKELTETYKPLRVMLVDMFPRTAHFESLILFARKE